MPIYRRDSSGQFLPFEATPFADLERVLEDWIEANPHLLLSGEGLAIVARQPRTTFGKYLDLLAVDESGACIVVELKRGEAPRDVIAQTLEYAAWVDSLTLDQLDEFARAYALGRGSEVDGIAGLYQRAFAAELQDGDAAQLSEHITFNNRQRLVVVAEHFSPEVEQTLRYLRTKVGVDITGVQFGIHTAGGETILQTDVLVGREVRAAVADRSRAPAASEPHDVTVGRVKTAFVRAAVTGIEDWIGAECAAAAEVRHGTASDHYIFIHGRRAAWYYFAQRWVFCMLQHRQPGEVELLRAQLSKPEEVKEVGDGVRFHIAGEADLEVLKQRIHARLAGTPS